MKIQALVKRKRRIRTGRGFSKGELREVNLSVREALKLGIPVDVRRSTKHNENIKILKSYLTESLHAEKPSRPAKIRSKSVKKKSEEKAGETMLDLTRVPGIGQKRAQQLKNAGINSVEKLAEADPKELSKILQVAEKSVSKWIANAKQVLQTSKK